MGLESEFTVLQSIVDDESILPEELGNLCVEEANEKLLEEIKIGGTGSSSPSVTKSQGLRKWRRIPRDLVKKAGGNLNGREIGDLTVVDVNGGSVVSDDQQRNGGTGPEKKVRGFKIESENSKSTIGSVFVQGSDTVTSIAKYDEEPSDDACYADKRLNEEARIAFMKTDDESDDVSMEQDPLVESVKGLHFAQMGLEREVQEWREIGQDDPLTFDGPLHEVLEVKDAKILELESVINSGDIKTDLEDRLMKIIQTEVEYVVITTTTKILTEGLLPEITHDDLQEKNVSSQAKEAQDCKTKKDLKKLQNRVCKFTSCFIVMLILFILTIYLEFAPQNVEVVPVPT